MSRIVRIFHEHHTLENRLFHITSNTSAFHTSTIYRKDYYDVLNIKRDSSPQEIKLAYYKLSKQYHPDVNNSKNAENNFKEIQEAYGILGDELHKREYDESLRYPKGGVYDEHFKAQYKNAKRPYTYEGANPFKRPESKEDINFENNYWNNDVFSTQDKRVLNKIFKKVIYVFFLYFLFYTVFSITSENEKAAALRSYRKQLEAKNNKTS